MSLALADRQDYICSDHILTNYLTRYAEMRNELTKCSGVWNKARKPDCRRMILARLKKAAQFVLSAAGPPLLGQFRAIPLS